MTDLAVSIVVYHSDPGRLAATLRSLDRAVAEALRQGVLDRVALYLIDNAECPDEELPGLLERSIDRSRYHGVERLAGQGNIGYGRAHNLALRRAGTAYHLVLNPDVELATDALVRALRFMEIEPTVGLLAPAVTDEQGAPQYLCRRYPSVLVLLLRGFVPTALRRPWRDRLARYELRDRIDGRTTVRDVPLISGCWMLLRRATITATGGFDPRFFLYFEDYDLSLRAARVARLVYLPEVRIVHHGGGAVAKGPRHIGLFLRSAVRFFNRHGWVWV